MSSMILVFALLAMFGAIFLGSVALNAGYAERRRALRRLESEVGEVTNLRQEELARSFTERVLLPLVSRFGNATRRLTPLDARRRLAHKLVLAGNPRGWDAEKVAAFKMLGAGAGFVLSFLLARAGHAQASRSIGMAILLVVIGFFGPDAMLTRIGRDRQEQIRRSLPDTLDLITITVEAGLGFDAALSQVLQHVPGPLTQEIGRTLHEMRLGVSRVDAFRHLAKRTDVEELRSFVLAMVQADTLGVSITKVLRAQTKQLRTKRRQYAEEKAMRVPVKILFPLIFCILPALFVVILGPGIIQIAENLFGLTP
jgi:tight adherence protein C